MNDSPDGDEIELLAQKPSPNWCHKLGYLLANLIAITLVASVPRTPLHNGEATTVIMFVLLVSAAVVAYLLVQGSDPGYITADMVREDILLDADIELNAWSTEIADDDANEPEGHRPAQEHVEAKVNSSSAAPLRAPPCTVCEFIPPIRSHHCRACNRCVATFDHHCFVIGTCIGERNHCRFWWFLFLQLAALWFAAHLVSDGFVSAPTIKQWANENQLALFASFIIYVFLFYCLLLVGFQTWLALSSMTGYECIRGPSRLWYLRGTEDFDLPYATTLCGNLMGFCCMRDQLCWWFRRQPWVPTQWRLPGRIDRESEDIWNHCWQNKYWSCC